MQQRQVLDPVYAPMKRNAYNRWTLPLPAVSLFTRLNNLLAASALTTTLHTLEVSEGEDGKASQYITVSIKLRGWLNLELLKRQMNALFHDYKRNLAVPLATSSLSLRNFVKFPVAEQRIELRQSGFNEEQSYCILLSDSQVYISMSRLHKDVHVLRIMMQQGVSNAAAVTLLIRELLEILFASHPDTTLYNATEGTEPDNIIDIDIHTLTERELEILAHVSQGLSNREIAQECCITEGTVKRHMNNIYAKLNVRSRTQAVARAQALKLFA